MLPMVAAAAVVTVGSAKRADFIDAVCGSFPALLVPAVVSLFGRWSWWLPPGMARLLRVKPSPEPLAEPG